jgi:hypothetical protein
MNENDPQRESRPSGRNRRSNQRPNRQPGYTPRPAQMERALLEAGRPPVAVVVYSLVTVVIGVGALIWLISTLPFSADQIPGGGTNTRTFILTLVTMLASGWLGGTLYNLRGLIKHTSDHDFLASHSLSYYLRPFAGAVSGLIVFFLLLGGVMMLTIRANGTSSLPEWYTFVGRMPYIALALLSGYGSHEFMLKLKDLANTLFALSRPKPVERK